VSLESGYTVTPDRERAIELEWEGQP